MSKAPVTVIAVNPKAVCKKKACRRSTASSCAWTEAWTEASCGYHCRCLKMGKILSMIAVVTQEQSVCGYWQYHQYSQHYALL